MFSEMIKKRRKELAWTQQDLADKLFVTRQTISNWENGKNFPDIPTLIQISDQLELSLDYLLKGDANYMKKVEKDYAMIARAKKARKLGRVVAALTIAVILICLSGNTLINQQILSEKWLVVIILTLCLPLEIFSYILYKTYFKDDSNPIQPLWVPKAYGVGLAINPNHFIGKFIWVVIFIFIFGLWFYALFLL
ncbi:helix-turn-helix domain-containing protein [Enterococcus sp. HY326]|uniref:helix-turn-helix domain-containing protein n=1 Tax=Enterococcus sp. HY326 TaxID=2971265 RepID=UPI0022403BAC|nr:helix-turn-helix transcriptional regulator [Enterococcus sp. HY326]